MKVVYTKEEAPDTLSKSIFLAGPTPRSKKTKSWRPEALQILEALGYDGVVFYPEYSDGVWKEDGVIEWEDKHLNMADCIVFWVPRKISNMPAFTTNTEWGRWENSGKVVFGAPPWAKKVNYQKHYAKKWNVPLFDNLKETLQSAIEMIGKGDIRTGGEKEVPLYIWRTASFQQWYQAQKQAGNRLDGARVEWTFRAHKKTFVVFWALHVNIYVASEGRNKTNEVVISRPDISTILMYRRRKILDDYDIVLIREFRSPVSNESGFVWEMPSGSSIKLKYNPAEVAADECMEETGLTIDPRRIKCHRSRQLAATFSTHKAHLFSVEISEDELNFLRSQYGIAHGITEHGERTYVEIRKLSEIKRQPNIDWSTLGMILSVFTGE